MAEIVSHTSSSKMGLSPIISDLLRIWINAVVQLEFILLIILALLFAVYSTTQYYRLLSHFTVAVRYLLVSRLSLVVVAFADQIWTLARAVVSLQVQLRSPQIIYIPIIQFGLQNMNTVTSCTPYIRRHDMPHNSQILHSDQTRYSEIFIGLTTPRT